MIQKINEGITGAEASNIIYYNDKELERSKLNKSEVLTEQPYGGTISSLNTGDPTGSNAFNDVAISMGGKLGYLKGVFTAAGILKLVVLTRTVGTTFRVEKVVDISVGAGAQEIDLSGLNIEVQEGQYVGYSKEGTARPKYGSSAGLAFGWYQNQAALVVGSSYNFTNVATANINLDYKVISSKLDNFVEKPDLYTDIVNNAYNYLTGGPAAGLGNDAPAVVTGYIQNIRINATTTGVATFQILDRVTNTATASGQRDTFKVVKTFDVAVASTGIVDIEVTENIKITEGQYLLQVFATGKVGPTFGSASPNLGWWQYGTGEIPGQADLTYQAANTVSLSFTIRKEKYERVTEVSEGVQYVDVIVERNAENYNSVRNTLKAITDNAINKIYRVFVPAGVWPEIDLTGKPFVEIRGAGTNLTTLLVDPLGSMQNLVAPADYIAPSEAGKLLKNISQPWRHLFFITRDTFVEDLTIDARDSKYPLHIDNPGYKVAHFKNVRIKEKDCNFVIGVGINGGQLINIENSIIERVNSAGNMGVFFHNWNNQGSKAIMNIVNSKFKGCEYALIDELGSDHPDEFNLINCFKEGATSGDLRLMVDKNGQGNTYWTNPLTGEKEPNPANVPYNIVVNTAGTQIRNITSAYSGTFNAAWAGIPQRNIDTFKDSSIIQM